MSNIGVINSNIEEKFPMKLKDIELEIMSSTESAQSYFTTRPTTTVHYNTGNPFTNPVYVEWYWVVLGLIIPILLGTLFCILDHLRRKKSRNSRQTEQRLESMCERNKYVPPKYEEIILNNHIVIEPVPQLELPLSTTRQPVFTIEAEQPAVHYPTTSKPVTSAAQATTSTNENIHTVNSSTNLSAEYNGSHASTSKAVEDNLLNDQVDVTTIEEPPSYEEYHKYELYGSRAELV